MYNIGKDIERSGKMKEKEMISLLLDKDETGLQKFLKHYTPLIRYIISPILSDTSDREECISEIAFTVWDKISLFDSEKGSFTSWLTAVSRNTALNRKRKIRPSVSVEDIPTEIPSLLPSPEDLILQKEAQKALSEALKNLSKKELTLFYRKYYYMQSTSQISAETGMSERAVEGRLYRIKRKLRKHMGGDANE